MQCLVVASLVSLLCFRLCFLFFRIHFRVRANYDKLCFPISFRLPFRRSTEGSVLFYGPVKKRVKLRVIEIMYKLMNLRMVEVCTPHAGQATKRWRKGAGVGSRDRFAFCTGRKGAQRAEFLQATNDAFTQSMVRVYDVGFERSGPKALG